MLTAGPMYRLHRDFREFSRSAAGKISSVISVCVEH
jgi:hypothetical protein